MWISILVTFVSLFPSIADADFALTVFNDSTIISILGSTHFVACSPADIARLPGLDSVVSKNTALIVQENDYDFVTPRLITTINDTRSVFEEAVRAREEANRTYIAQVNLVSQLQQQVQLGLDNDNEGQVWLLLRLAEADLQQATAMLNYTVSVDNGLWQNRTEEYRAVYPKNYHETFSNASCIDRLRLNPSVAKSAGAVWYSTPQSVFGGFNTTFTFQISAKNQICTTNSEIRSILQKGTVISQQSYTCIETGADGFAFVIQSSGLQAIGNSGAFLGYDLVNSSIAVEFDTFANLDISDPNGMHVAVHISGFGHQNAPDASKRVGYYGYLSDTGRNLQDGQIHTCRIIYTPTLAFDPFQQPQWKASLYLKQFLKGSLGTFRVFIDDMVTAVINFPINLATALGSNATDVYVGFTSATGSQWQQHDILTWNFQSLS